MSLTTIPVRKAKEDKTVQDSITTHRRITGRVRIGLLIIAIAAMLSGSALVALSPARAATLPYEQPVTPPPPAPSRVPSASLEGGCAISTTTCTSSTSTTAPSTPAWGSLALPTIAVQPSKAGIERKAVIYMFWGDGCPHCAAAKPFLEQLTMHYDDVEVRDYEVWHDEGNRALFARMAVAHRFEPRAVPTFLLGERYWVGYTEQIGQEIERAVTACLDAGCSDAGAGIVTPSAAKPPLAMNEVPAEQTTGLTLPLFGTVDLQHQSLVLSTALIAFVDGFNPCSLWVLTMLLAITLHTGSRKKVLIIGLVFLTVTAGIYALFIAGLFTVFTFASVTGWVQWVVAVVALFFAAINVKDYFWYKEGISLTIADEKKPGLFQRMRKLVDASQSFWGLVGATVVLAAGVSLVEFSCTAGFPVIWTNLLTAQQVGAVTFLALLAIYLLIYQLDELGVFIASVVTLKAARLEEKQGRMLKLAGGMLMLTLAVVMLVNPTLMNNLGNSLLIFGIALGATLAILVLHRRILPAFGIWIGTEGKSKRARSGRRNT
jgi:glutaredoxin